MRTNQYMKALCTPALYLNVIACYEPTKHNLFSSKESTQALGRNVRRVRQLKLWLIDMAYYVNCVIAHQELLSAQSNTAVGDLEQQQRQQQQQQLMSRYRSLWLAPPILHVRTVIPIPPMTHLTKLDIGMNWSLDAEHCPYYFPSHMDARETLIHTCWIMDSNPQLQDVRLRNLILDDDRDIALFTTSIFGLEELQKLNLYVFTLNWEMLSEGPWPPTSIFFSCPPSLQSLEIYLSADEDSLEGFSGHQRWPEGLHSKEVSDEECRSVTVPRRQEPLTHLIRLSFSDNIGDDFAMSKADFLSILDHSPNLLDLMIPTVSPIGNVQTLAQEVVQRCPKVDRLNQVGIIRNGDAQELMLQILEKLPPQQVQRFGFQGIYPLWMWDAIEFRFLRHASTLREVIITCILNVDSKAIQVLLVECRALELLDIHRCEDESMESLAITLEDATEFPWACTRIRTLGLTVIIPVLPFYQLSPDVVPYYNRLSPTTLSAAEAEQFHSLEDLYRQLGALTELRWLRLHTLLSGLGAPDPRSPYPRANCYRIYPFPGLLNLSCEKTGRPGFLYHLAGLTKLETLLGSVSVTAEETKETVGTAEAVWMEQHWPRLKVAQFFGMEQEITEPFRWFKDQREEKGQSLDLHGRTVEYDDFTPIYS
ncbi:hypothetical protein BGZ96_012069 [Linnemannia gamsii]|uniref:Uncharacterized protein n=1 Tax=Linnemannia gamsii TaxID=64522 RepID=A0ABQ7KC26_9FUNG|nr:hypothetical protein BGZ96_012069 [Linnemannia gamsii]